MLVNFIGYATCLYLSTTGNETPAILLMMWLILSEIHYKDKK